MNAGLPPAVKQALESSRIPSSTALASITSHGGQSTAQLSDVSSPLHASSPQTGGFASAWSSASVPLNLFTSHEFAVMPGICADELYWWIVHASHASGTSGHDEP